MSWRVFFIGSLVALVTTFVLLVKSCRDGVPEVVSTRLYPSPDGKLVITDEIVSNGLGMGASAVYEEIHLSDPGHRFSHGDRDDSSVFYMNARPTDTYRVRIRWVDSSHVVIGYPAPERPAKLASRRSGVAIAYETFPSDRGPTQ
jgi:hypothetical protein